MSSVVFELVCTSLQQFTIMFEHPLQDTMVTGKNGSLLLEYQLSFFLLHVEKKWREDHPYCILISFNIDFIVELIHKT